MKYWNPEGVFPIIESLSNDDGDSDGNENGKMATGLD